MTAHPGLALAANGGDPERTWRDRLRVLGFPVPAYGTAVHGSHLTSARADYHAALTACRKFTDASPASELAWLARSTICQRLGFGEEWRSCRRHIADLVARRSGFRDRDLDAVKAFVLAAEGASGGQPGTTPPAYVRQMFDQYAERFDAHLLGELEYRGHIDVVDLVSRLKDGDLRVLDLGCGTGLVGAELQRVPGSHRIHGVDIAPQMLERASARRIYTALHCKDILEFLGDTTPSFDAITAADVLIYLGEVEPLFARVRETLNCEGVFVFTIERNDDDLGVKLTPSRRYRHGEAYVRRCADNAGLAVLACEPIMIRQELQGAVDGFVVALTVS